MPHSAVTTFTDPDAYHAAIRNAQVEGVVTGRGSFRAELTRIDLHRLWIQRGDESLPRVLRAATGAKRAGIIFPTSMNQPSMYFTGTELSAGEIMVGRVGTVDHHRSTAACQWGSMTLPLEDFATATRAITGRDFIPPSFTHRIRPDPLAMSRLLYLHKAAGHLAKTAPNVLAEPEVARAIEQALAQAMITCLAEDKAAEPDITDRVQRRIMLRLEDMLQANIDRPLYVADLCNAAGVSDRTLRAYCHQHLGMSPMRYFWLRRMHMARGALLRADPTATSVTEIAVSHGFWEFGRFSVTYRSLFGESPSASLRRVPETYCAPA
jgi:AraC-like DNA-binding protein